jgi:hypothetical protein
MVVFLKPKNSRFPTARYIGVEEQQQGTNWYWFLMVVFLKPRNSIFQRLATAGPKARKTSFCFVTNLLFTAP